MDADTDEPISASAPSTQEDKLESMDADSNPYAADLAILRLDAMPTDFIAFKVYVASLRKNATEDEMNDIATAVKNVKAFLMGKMKVPTNKKVSKPGSSSGVRRPQRKSADIDDL